jgi:light-regulated signal transduction histidine kinase (bacteriophytochrome)
VSRAVSAAILSRIEACEAHSYRHASQIQPHGRLLAVDPDTQRVVRASANAGTLFGRESGALIGATLADLFAPDSVRRIADSLHGGGDGRSSLSVATIGTPDCPGAAMLYASGDLRCIEIEPPGPEGDAGDLGVLSSGFFEMVERIGRADIQSGALAGIACAAIREITGFDRVYFCRFDRHGHGHVLGESRGDALASLMDHHFPATDVPWAARAIYLVNPSRLIADVDAAPVDILGDGGPLDLGMSTCRAIAPTHLQYLRNMGVGASVSFSLVVDGRLAAIFGGHHTAPHPLSWQRLATCRHVVDLFQTRFEFLKAREERRRLASGVEGLYDLSARFRLADRDLGQFVAANHDAFCALMEADDLLCRFERQTHTGRTLAAREANALLDFLSHRLEAGGECLATDCVAELHAGFAALAPGVAGVLAIPLDLSCTNLIVWLRAETVVAERWSGNPHEPVVVGAQGAIGPRTSFEAYTRDMRGRCVEWSNATMDLARQSRHAFNQVLAAHYEIGMRAAAEQANALKSEFIANITHELRSPMHAIIGLSDVLANTNAAISPEQCQRYAGTIRDSGQRLLLLIDDLLDLSQLEAGKMGFTFAPGDIAATIDRAIDEVAPLAAAKGVRLVRPERRAWPACLHDAARMHQVMINLLSNAIKFSPVDGRVTITLAASEPGPGGVSLLIEVADEGPGIPEGECEMIFDKFVQSSRTKNGAGGTGLGLSISREIVEAHHGHIWAANNRAGGASLFVSVPLVYPQRERAG